jgi:hypothetical protein
VEAFAQPAIGMPVKGIAVPSVHGIQRRQQIPVLHSIG